MQIYEVHRKVKNNVGDYYCNPSRYFDFPNVQSGELLHNKFPIQDQTIVIGGGGLIHKKFSDHIQRLIAKNPKHTVLWGIGHNFNNKAVAKGAKFYPDFLDKCSLVGIRDYINKDLYLPCVSCMHPAFDKSYTVKHKVAYFTHAFKSKYQYTDGDVQMPNSNMDFDNVIEFLGSANTIITDSYHGAYWAQLLGKDVRVLSWSVKFNHMKHQPTMLPHISQWQDTSPSIAPSGFLEECRSLNNKFYQDFLNLL